MHLHRRTALSVSIATIVALALAGSAAAGGNDQEQVRLTAAGQAAAKAATLRLADLGSGFAGGPVASAGSSVPDCASYHPKQSDLVENGDAATSFAQGPVRIESDANVLATAAMVRTDWQRTVRPAITGCLRSVFARSLGAGGSRVVSVSDLPFPQVATYAHGYRAVLSIVKGGTTTRVVSDFILIGRGRTEITLNVTSPPDAAAVAAEVALARRLAARISA